MSQSPRTTLMAGLLPLWLFKGIVIGLWKMVEIPTSYMSAICITTEVSPNLCLTHWGQVMHICLSKLTIIGSDNGLSPGRCQAIIWTNAGILLIGPLGTNFIEILIKIFAFSLKKMDLKMLSGKWRLFVSVSSQSHQALKRVMCPTWLTVLWPPGWECVTVKETKRAGSCRSGHFFTFVAFEIYASLIC